jgi:KUP system potassium uptake protein
MSATEQGTAVDCAAAGPPGDASAHHAPGLLPASLGALGVVYGDIGTSPLYAFKERLHAATGGGEATPEAAIGIVSLILWTLMVIVTMKYVALVMRADSNGEGGILTLSALAQRATGARLTGTVAVLGMVGASLFYGDAVITPAVSVLSAVEGLGLVTPALTPYVIPLSLCILVALFLAQSRGTAAMAGVFGPVMALWFALFGIAAVPHVAAQPAILAALNPVHGVTFLLSHGFVAFLTLGSVFLAVTGAEALYGDMGHFGRRPIRLAWGGLVLPALALNYLGQGALVIGNPAAAENPFFLMFPSWSLVPMVLLATLATVIASQAVISGAFSLTRQAIQLGLLPRMAILQTSSTVLGQVYVPRINWILLAGVLLLVATFRSSNALAAAYGIAVSGTMVVTALLTYLVARFKWGWNPWVAALVVAPFLALDIVFLCANSLKIHEGGWLPLLIGGLILCVMLTWRRGLGMLRRTEENARMPLAEFARTMRNSSAVRVGGTAVFLTPYPDDVPAALLHNLKHNQVLHAANVVLTVKVQERPRVPEAERGEVEDLGDGFHRATLRFGFMETPDVPSALWALRCRGLRLNPMRTSYFVSQRVLRTSKASAMPRWQDLLFVSLARTTLDSSRHFGLPPDRSVAIGMVVDI